MSRVLCVCSLCVFSVGVLCGLCQGAKERKQVSLSRCIVLRYKYINILLLIVLYFFYLRYS